MISFAAVSASEICGSAKRSIALRGFTDETVLPFNNFEFYKPCCFPELMCTTDNHFIQLLVTVC